MISESILNLVLKVIVGIKELLTTDDPKTVIQLVAPIVFGISWIIICYFSKKKDGEYGAPPGLLYNTSKEDQ